MEDLYKLITFLVGLVSGWTLKVLVDKSSNNVTQHSNTAGGDIAGRDINKK